MENLLDLYEFYIQTQPSSGKVKSATTMLIHVCKALDVNAPEEVTVDLFEEIPRAIGEFYQSSPGKALHDKSVLAEMIGHYGPRDGWEKPFEYLLNDPDENLRQFTLSALQFYGESHSESIIPYIERYKNSENQLIKDVTANLVGKLLCSEHSEPLKIKLKEWSENGDREFIDNVGRFLENQLSRNENVSNTDIGEWFRVMFEDNTK